MVFILLTLTLADCHSEFQACVRRADALPKAEAINARRACHITFAQCVERKNWMRSSPSTD